MQRRDLAHNTAIEKALVESIDHAVDVLSTLHKSEASLKRNGPDNIKCIPLQPHTEVNTLTFQVPHGVDEDLSTLVRERLEGFD